MLTVLGGCGSDGVTANPATSPGAVASLTSSSSAPLTTRLPAPAPTVPVVVQTTQDVRDVEPSADCLDRFATAARLLAVTQGNPSVEPAYDEAYRQTAEACTTPEEWLVALVRHPDAAGLRSNPPTDAYIRELRLVCAFAGETPMCQLAAQRGLLD